MNRPTARGVMDNLKKAHTAIKILKLYNPLRNDLDAFLDVVCDWGLGNAEKPNPDDFGLQDDISDL